ncbi:MAG: hypothetical protein KGO51_08410 [Alphaproteobacteria bacterium]|nr:hypothetical protein [Alphaproteobacteria bacterium]
MFRCRYFLELPEPVREELDASRRLCLVQESAANIMRERRYLRAEIWREDQLVGLLRPET